MGGKAPISIDVHVLTRVDHDDGSHAECMVLSAFTSASKADAAATSAKRAWMKKDDPRYHEEFAQYYPDHTIEEHWEGMRAHYRRENRPLTEFTIHTVKLR